MIQKNSVVRWVFLLGIACLFQACSVHDTSKEQMFAAEQRWALLPVMNYSEEPLAGESAEAMLETLLRMRGANKLIHYPVLDSGALPELNERKRLDTALAWARSQGLRYGFSGVVTEWRYKSGLDAEPVVGMTLQIIDVVSGQVVWSSSAARSGWGRESLSGNAQKVLRELVDSIQFSSGN